MIRRAVAADYDTVKTLLESAALPPEGVAQHFENFFVAEADGVVIGAIGLEVYVDNALLRSAVVHASQRGTGIGTTLYDALLNYARKIGLRRLILLTDTAERFFEHKGFRRIDARTVTGSIRTSVEFTGACPSTAVCMELKL